MKRSLIIVLGIATLVKLVLAAVTIGTNDVANAAVRHRCLLGGASRLRPLANGGY